MKQLPRLERIAHEIEEKYLSRIDLTIAAAALAVLEKYFTEEKQS